MSMLNRDPVLILRDVSLRDFTPQVFAAIRAPEPTQAFAELPAKFIATQENIDAWQRQRYNIHCWECGLLITGWVKFIPESPQIEIINKQSVDVCEPKTPCCEWGCVARWVRLNVPPGLQYETMQRVCIYESKFTNLPMRKIMPESQPKTKMRQYSGDAQGMTQKAWQEKNLAIYNDRDLVTWRLDQLSKPH